MRTFFTSGESPEGSAASGLDLHILHAESGVVTLPNSEVMLQGMYSRAGSDLVISTPEDGKFVVKGFFLTDPPPSLSDGHETQISGDVAAQFAGPLAPGQYAGQAAAPALLVGQVRSMTGTVTAIRADGSTVTLQVGDPVYQDDIIETAAGANVGVVFVDGTTLALGENGEMVLDELVYDPASKAGKATLSLVSGAAEFVSGAIAKSGQDNMTFNTPVGTIGIRGTKVFVSFDPTTGDVTILNRPTGVDALGNVLAGEIVLTLPNGQVIGSMTASNGGWQWNPTQGQAPQTVQLTEAQVNAIAGGVVNAVNGLQQDILTNPPPVVPPAGTPGGGPAPGAPGGPPLPGTTTDDTGTVTTTITAADGTTTTITTGAAPAPTSFNVGTAAVTNNPVPVTPVTVTPPAVVAPPGVVVPPPPPPVILPAEFRIVGGGPVSDQTAGVVELTIERFGNTTIAGSVTYTAGGGTATAGTDYGAVTGTVVFAAGETSKQIIVPVFASGRNEGAETFNVTLSGASAGSVISGATAVVTINEDLALPTLSINNFAISDTQPGTAVLTVTRSGALYGPASVNFASVAGTAEAGSDYLGVTGVINFAAGQSTASINIPILANSTPLKLSNREGEETFTVVLSNAVDATIANGTGTVTINADAVVGQATFSIASAVSAREGDTITLTVTRGGDLVGEVSVTYATATGTAGTADFGAATGTLTFAANETIKTITIPITADGISPAEPSENFTVNLSAPVGGTIAAGSTVVTIAADAAPSTFSITGGSAPEGGTATVTVTRGGDLSGTVSVNYQTANGTAGSSDYTGGSGTLTFAPNETIQTISFPIAADGTSPAEETEFFIVSLSNPTGGTIANGSANVFIDGDTSAPVTPPSNNHVPSYVGIVYDNAYAQFDGIRYGFETSGNISFSSHTMEAWIRNGRDDGDYQTIATVNDGVKSAGMWVVNGVLSVYLDLAAGEHKEVQSSVQVSDDEWHHVAYTYNAVTGAVRIFIDGAEDTGASIVHNSSTLGFSITDTLNVGNHSVGEPYVGGIDELAIWSIVRTPEEIANNFGQHVPMSASGLEVYYLFDDFDGYAVYNQVSPGPLDGNLSDFGFMTPGSGSVPYELAVSLVHSDNRVLYFDSDVGTYIATGLSDTGELYSTDEDISVEATIRLAHGGSGDRTILVRQDDDNSEDFWVYINEDNHLVVSIDGVEALTSETNGYHLLDGVWYTIGVAYSDSADDLRIYINGNPVGSTSVSRSPISNTTIDIGRYMSNDERSFEGYMSNLRIWNVSLSSGDIYDNFVGTVDPDTEGLVVAYDFTEGGDSTVTDITDHGLDGVIHNGNQWFADVAGAADDITAFTTTEDRPFSFRVIAKDTDGDTITLSALSGPAHGDVVFGPGHSVRYTPDDDFNGSDSFTIQLSDGQGGMATKTFNVTVTPVDEPAGLPVEFIAGNGDWDEASNWNPAIVPNGSSAVSIDGADVSLANGNDSPGDNAVAGLELTNSAYLTLNSFEGLGTRLTINLSATIDETSRIILGENARLAGAGALESDGLIRADSSASYISLAGGVSNTGGIEIENGTLTYSGNLINQSDGEMFVVTNSDYDAQLTFASGAALQNEGYIYLTSRDSDGNNGEAATLNAGEGSISNSGTIATELGEFDHADGGERLLKGSITNQNGGTLDINYDAVYSDGTLMNQGNIYIASGNQLTIDVGATLVLDSGTSLSDGGMGSVGFLYIANGASLSLKTDITTSFSGPSITLGDTEAGSGSNAQIIQHGSFSGGSGDPLRLNSALNLHRADVYLEITVDDNGHVNIYNTSDVTFYDDITVSGGNLNIYAFSDDSYVTFNAAPLSIVDEGDVTISTSSGQVATLSTGSQVYINNGSKLTTSGSGSVVLDIASLTNANSGSSSTIQIEADTSLMGTLYNSNRINIVNTKKLTIDDGRTVYNNSSSGRYQSSTSDGTLFFSNTSNFVLSATAVIENGLRVDVGDASDAGVAARWDTDSWDNDPANAQYVQVQGIVYLNKAEVTVSLDIENGGSVLLTDSNDISYIYANATIYSGGQLVVEATTSNSRATFADADLYNEGTVRLTSTSGNVAQFLASADGVFTTVNGGQFITEGDGTAEIFGNHIVIEAGGTASFTVNTLIAGTLINNASGLIDVKDMTADAVSTILTFGASGQLKNSGTLQLSSSVSNTDAAKVHFGDNGHLGGTLLLAAEQFTTATSGTISNVITTTSGFIGMFSEIQGMELGNMVGSKVLDPIFTSNLSFNVRDVTHVGAATGTSGDDVMLDGPGGNTIDGGAGNDYISGGDDGDVLIGGLGDDRLIGGNGLDTADYSGASGAVNVDLYAGTSSGADGNDTLIGIENVLGSAYQDNISGDAGVNLLNGGADDDHIVGRGGADTLIGGSGSDTFHFLSVDDFGDTITDFVTAVDEIRFYGFFDLGTTGAAQSGVNFSSITVSYDGTNAENDGANSRFANGDASLIYSSADYTLYYDSNGADSGYTIVATFLGSPTLVAGDVSYSIPS